MIINESLIIKKNRIMKLKIYLLAGILLSGVSQAHAEVEMEMGQCGDSVYWYFEDSVLTVFGQGNFHDRTYEYLNNQIKSVVIREGVTAMREDAFADFPSLTSLTLPKSFLFIGNRAFFNCPNFTTVITLNPTPPVISYWEAFENYASITAYVPFGSVEAYRSEGVWDMCRIVESDSVSDPVPVPVTGFTLNEDSLRLERDATFQLVPSILPEDATDRDIFWYSDNTKVATVSQTGLVTVLSAGSAIISAMTADGRFKDTVTVMVIVEGKDGACGDNLTWSLNDSVLTISGTGQMWDFGDWCRFESPLHSSEEASTEFKESIKTVIIEKGVTTIGANAFAHCPSLTSATIPEGVTAIGAYAFSNCHSLTSVIIPNSVTSIGLEAFSYDFSLTSVTLPEGLSRIERGAFFADTVLVSVNIPDSVTSIGVHAFTSCYALTSVTLPEGLSRIEEYAFASTGLVSVTVPCSVTEINNCAFGSCHSLEKITVSYPQPIRIDSLVFYNFLDGEVLELEDITLEVPLDCSSVYAGSEVWSEFNIVESPNNTVCGGDATLDSLTVNAANAAISFPFHPDTLNYAFDVENAIDSIIIEAVPNDIHASVTGEGRYPLTVWENTFEVEVTAENGIASRIYTVKVTRLPADPNPDSVSLKNLVVSIGSLDPEFDRNIFNYTVQLPCPVNSVTIGATPGDTFSTVSGDGTYRFPCGGNPFTVTVTVTKPHPRKPQKDYRIRINPEYPTGLEKTGKQPVQVYFDSNILHLDSPAAEHINIYSVTGTLLYGFDKPAGAFTLHPSPFILHPSPVLIVKGSSGWVKKMIQ